MTESQPLSKDFADNLLAILRQIPALDDPDARTQLLRGLPREPIGAIPRSSAAATDLGNIVAHAERWETVAGGEWALVVIAQNALGVAEGTGPGEALGALLDEVDEPQPLPQADEAPPVTIDYPLQVFLCHASQDKPAVRELYHKLRQAGLNPWLDEVELLPGQRWQREIPPAVRASDVVIV